MLFDAGLIGSTLLLAQVGFVPLLPPVPFVPRRLFHRWRWSRAACSTGAVRPATSQSPLFSTECLAGGVVQYKVLSLGQNITL